MVGVVSRRVCIPTAYIPTRDPYCKRGACAEVVGDVHGGHVVHLEGTTGGLRLSSADVSCLPSSLSTSVDPAGALERLDIFDRLGDGHVSVGALSLALAESIAEANGVDRVLDGGMSILKRGHSFKGWDTSFTYHCKEANGGVKRFLDIQDSTIELFFGANPHSSARHYPRHGEKVLTPFGSAVFVGVAKPVKDGDVWIPIWHPSGSTFGVPWPMGHAFCLGGGCGMVSLGQVDVELNGPTLHCPHNEKEDISRYLHTTSTLQVASPGGGDYAVEIDATNWLAREMFGVEIGAPLPKAEHLIALGVGVRPDGVDQCAPLIDLYVKNSLTNTIKSASLGLAF